MATATSTRSFEIHDHPSIHDPARSYTSDLCDFLRSTGPELAPPDIPSTPTTQGPSFFRRVLKKREKQPAKRVPSFSSVAAINKALHQVPPPNVEPKVFANGQTIYMINKPTPPSLSSLRVTPKPISPPKPSSLHSRSSSGKSSHFSTPRPPSPTPRRPPIPVFPRTLSPIGSASATEGEYDLRFDSSATEPESGAEIDASDIDPSLNATILTAKSVPRLAASSSSLSSFRTTTPSSRSRQSSAGSVNARSVHTRSGSVATVLNSNDPERASLRISSPRYRRRSGPSDSPQNSTISKGGGGPTPDIWVSRDIAASPRLSPARKSASPPRVLRDRAGSEHAPRSPVMANIPLDARRDRSASLNMPPTLATKRSSVLNGLVMVAPPNPPPAGPPPPTPSITRSPSRPASSPRQQTARLRATLTTTPPRTTTAERPSTEAFYTPNTSPQATIFVPLPTQQPPPLTRRGSAPNPAPRAVDPPPDFASYAFPPPHAYTSSEDEAAAKRNTAPVPIQSGFVTPERRPSARNLKLSTLSHPGKKVRESPSMLLDRQLEDVLKINDTYLELAVKAKKEQEDRLRREREERELEAQREPRSSSEDPNTVLVPPATNLDPYSPTRTSISSTRSGGTSSSSSNAVIGVASIVTATRGPPRLPLPPSPIMQQTSPSSPPTPQAQIASLTYALHTQRSQYESLSAHIIQLQASWDDQRAVLEARIAELEASSGRQRESTITQDLVSKSLSDAERMEYEKRIEECEQALESKERRIHQLEEEKFEWEKERKGLRWLVGVGRLGAVPLRPSDSEATVVGETPDLTPDATNTPTTAFDDPSPRVVGGPYFTPPPPSRVFTFSEPQVVVNLPDAKGEKRRPVTGTTSRPVSLVSESALSRTSMDDGLLGVVRDAAVKRHSMYESGRKGRPLSVALEDMLVQLRGLADVEKGVLGSPVVIGDKE
ncbi:hypothetical protein FRB99_000204 [Tulasnella sp. 403]|nr:hypothetical protein FRB99_000204 [Tulasnella sp. 403]